MFTGLVMLQSMHAIPAGALYSAKAAVRNQVKVGQPRATIISPA